MPTRRGVATASLNKGAGMQQVFDGHNDLLLRLWRNALAGADPVVEFVEGHPAGLGHIDLPRARAGGLAGGFCAIFVPSPGQFALSKPDRTGAFATPMAGPLEREPALDLTLAMAAIALQLDRAGAWSLCRTVAEIEAAIAAGRFAAVLHIEGCEGIGADLSGLEVLYAAGLRSLGPVWSRNNVFANGVPFAYPAGPDVGAGLTEAGKDLVRACNKMGILIDLSHMNESGFFDVAALSDQPLVATHSNVHAITPSTRNLTDRQLDAVRASGGIVGLNFAVSFLRQDGQERADTGVSTMVRHIDYLVDKLGIDGVALGSDFDGALIPAEIRDASGVQNLVAALRSAGYGDEELAKICRGNWLRILRSTWHETAAA